MEHRKECDHSQARQQGKLFAVIVAAIIHWNTVYLERAIRLLRQKGRNISDELLVHLSPLGWEHINLTGDYVWHANRRVTKGHFRPLRQPREAPVRWFEVRSIAK